MKNGENETLIDLGNHNTYLTIEEQLFKSNIVDDITRCVLKVSKVI